VKLKDIEFDAQRTPDSKPSILLSPVAVVVVVDVGEPKAFDRGGKTVLVDIGGSPSKSPGEFKLGGRSNNPSALIEDIISFLIYKIAMNFYCFFNVTFKI
jgi:hypothetical protein